MNIGQKIISGFLLIVLLMATVGYFGIRTAQKAQEGAVTEAKMSSLALKIAEKGTVTFTATLTKNLDELASLEEKANTLRDEIDSISSVLLKDPNLKDNVNFKSFLSVKNDHNKDQKQAFSIHRELLDRQALFGDSPSVEESVRQRLRAVINTINNPELLKSFGLVEVLSKEAIFQYRDKKSVDAWIESIRKLKNDIGGEDKALLDRVIVYQQTAEIVGDIIVRESEINTNEAILISAMRGREVELGTLRQNIVNELSINISQVYQNNYNILILVVVVGMLILMGVTGFFFSQRIIKPIRELTAVVMKIAGGNLGARAPVFSTDELGLLASSFNQMAGRLAEYPLRLQQEVERKTRELTQTNQRLAALNVELDKISKTVVRRDFELTQANDRLREIDQTKSQFVSIAAHQLRTPLSGIKWVLKLMLDGDMGSISSEQHGFIEKAYDANERMIRLVGDLLDVSRIEEGKFGYQFATGDLAALVKKVLDEYSLQVEAHNLSLVFKPPKTPLPLMFFDKDRLQLVLVNLLDNAINYTPAGGNIRVSVEYSGGLANVSVIDNGVGIPESQMPRIFNKFFRGSNVVRLQTDGTGLGLYISKNIIEAHGGTITIVSEEGKGTTVSFVIPAKLPVGSRAG